MATYATYTYYTTTYKGVAIATQAAFDRLAIQASAVIDLYTYNRAAAIIEEATDLTTIDKIRMATCAVAEELQKLDSAGGLVQSESLGNYSVTYAPRSGSGDISLAQAAKRWLWSTDLMYAGFTDDELSG